MVYISDTEDHTVYQILDVALVVGILYPTFLVINQIVQMGPMEYFKEFANFVEFFYCFICILNTVILNISDP